jgi:geranylgeranyl pyrophosphate synthase
MKSASIEADMHVAALFGSDDAAAANVMKKCGRVLGTLATLREEFIDVFEADELNQRVQSEALPLPIMYALQDAQSKVRIRNLLQKKKLSTTEVDKMVEIVFASESVTALIENMKKLAVADLSLVSRIKEPLAKATLRNLILSMLEDL